MGAFYQSLLNRLYGVQRPQAPPAPSAPFVYPSQFSQFVRDQRLQQLSPSRLGMRNPEQQLGDLRTILGEVYDEDDPAMMQQYRRFQRMRPRQLDLQVPKWNQILQNEDVLSNVDAAWLQDEPGIRY